jgi:NitT/TauT family transport system permease protein
MIWLGFSVAFWLVTWAINAALARSAAANTRAVKLLIPALFGAAVLVLWEGVVRGLQVPEVVLPAPSVIGAAIAANLPTLGLDWFQTIIKGGLTGYLIGAFVAVVVAVMVDRVPFLKRGLLPIGNFAAALPIVGIAPIMVMWFGFDWHSKAAVVVVMVFFPVLVNMVAGLEATDRLSRDLIATWGASYWQALFKLRFPAAMPFLFNGLKIGTTLALIGAIVAENFGSPTLGVGFRISTAVGQLALPLVWAEIAVAALSGSVFYGLVAAIEKAVTFWHPSQRR